MRKGPKSRNHLTKTTKEGKIELTEKELTQVTGGAADTFAKLGDIKGESIDDKHKDWIEISRRQLK